MIPINVGIEVEDKNNSEIWTEEVLEALEVLDPGLKMGKPHGKECMQSLEAQMACSDDQGNKWGC